MKLILAAAAAAVLSAAAVAPACAQGLPAPNPEISTYGTIGYTYLDGGSGVKFGVATARLGVKKGYLGAEVEGGIGVDGDDYLGVHFKLQHTIAGYATVTVPLANQFQVMGRVGYGTTRIKGSAFGVSASDNIDSVNYGAGVIYSFTEKDHLRAEYTRYDYKGSGGADGFSVAYVRKF